MKTPASSRINLRTSFITVFSLTILLSSLLISVTQIYVCSQMHAIGAGLKTVDNLHFIAYSLGGKNSTEVTGYKQDDLPTAIQNDVLQILNAGNYFDGIVVGKPKMLAVKPKEWKAFLKQRNDANFKAAVSNNMPK